MDISVIKSIVNHPKKLLSKINYRYPDLFKWMKDEQCLSFWYKYHLGKKLNLDNPQTFNEKLQWLKLYDRKPEYTSMVDKYIAKQYVAEKIGEQYIIPTLGVWECFDDIDFDQLPRQFVLKCTHDSGGLVICRDKNKFDKDKARKKISRSLKRNYYWVGREWPYRDVKPRIIAEQYVENVVGDDLLDYKMMCFNGQVRCSFVCTERHRKDGVKVTFFDRDWERMPFSRHYPTSDVRVAKPEQYEKMILLAEQLSEGMAFLRVDFYEVGRHIYFGELTFFPGSGFEEFTPVEWDYTLGSWITLPVKEA